MVDAGGDDGRAMQLAVADAAVALLAAAKAHKRSAAAHRRHARDCMTALSGIRDTAGRLGIELEIRPSKGEGGTPHGPEHEVAAGPVDAGT